MSDIVLIQCVSGKDTTKKGTKVKAEKLYTSDLFKKSLEYTKTLNAKAIYILSAKYGLVSLKEEIEYYNETLTYIPPAKRKNDVKVLTSEERKKWKEKVVEQLRTVSNLKEDTFIFLAGESYIKPLKKDLKNIETPLKGKGIGERLQFLNKINKIQ